MSDQNPPIPPARSSGRFKTVVAWVCGPIVLLQLIVLILSVAYFFGAGLHWKNSKPTFVSMGRLLVGGGEVNPKLEKGEPIPDSFYATNLELIMSSTVVKGAQMRVHALHPDLAPQYCTIDAGRLPNTSILVVKGTCENPAYVQAMVDAVMDEFLALRKQMTAGSPEDMMMAVQDELVRLEKEMRLTEEKQKAAKQSGADAEELDRLKSSADRLRRNYDRLVDSLRELDRKPKTGRLFTVLENASRAIGMAPRFSFSDLFK